MNEGEAFHIPVMAQEVLVHLNLSPDATVVDCTTGCGGHSQLIAGRLNERGRLIAVDRDKSSLAVARANLKDAKSRLEFVHKDFRNIDQVLTALGISQVNAMLFDLGISSFQLDDPQRGFSLKSEGPLDMRMNQEDLVSAKDLINSLNEREIADILKEYGEERWHKRIARHLVSRRPIETTQQLNEIILKAIPKGRAWQKIHPATRTFQAFRIAVNRELEAIEEALEKAVGFLAPEGRICVIAFHSLEDRIVKVKFRDWAKAGVVQLITKKPLQAGDDEISGNPRARSARLRVAEKI